LVRRCQAAAHHGTPHPTCLSDRTRPPEALMDVPIQFFQSVIAIELAVAGALLW
jgi:hypothetical protein